jgi:hypothetical protein
VLGAKLPASGVQEAVVQLGYLALLLLVHQGLLFTLISHPAVYLGRVHVPTQIGCIFDE